MPFSSDDVLKALRRAGYEFAGQRGSHLKLQRGARTVIVKHPDHDIPKGTFASILRQAGWTRREFEDLLHGRRN